MVNEYGFGWVSGWLKRKFASYDEKKVVNQCLNQGASWRIYDVVISPYKVNYILIRCCSLGSSPYSLLYGQYNAQIRCLPI